MKLALILLLAPLLPAQIFYPPGSVRRYAGTPTAGDCTASAGGRKAADISAIPTQPYTCIQTSSGVWEWQAEGSGGGGSGDVGGGPSLTTAGACVYVASNGTLAQATSPGCRWDAVNARLGLGTASPGATIDVTQVGSTPGARVSGGTNPVFQVATDTSGTGVTAKLQVVGSSYALFGTQTNHPLQVLTNNTARVTVTETGSVGIGTSNASPTGALHVRNAAAGGATTVTVQAGDTQSTTNVLQFTTSAGAVRGYIYSPDGATYNAHFYDFVTINQGAAVIDASGAGLFALGSSGTMKWSSTSVQSGTKDLGLARSPSLANTLLITNGSSNLWGIGGAGIQCLSGDGNSAACDVGTTGARVRDVNAARNITAAGNITGNNLASANVGAIFWSARAQMTSPADGQILLRNSDGTDFSLLQFGGTTSSFPALKRSTTGLAVRLADDSADAPITASNVTASSDFIGSSTSCLYLGATGTDGTWRICRSSTSIVFERRESGSYVSKGNFTP